MTESRHDPVVGALLDGRYEVRSLIARGGMSTVYLASDTRLERDVALKVMLPHLAEDDALVARFEREAKTAARISHPHVVGVLDQGHDRFGGQTFAYLVMEHVPGTTLRHVIREDAPLPVRAAFTYVLPLLEGLAEAHALGLMHRDVKPENVLVSPTGTVKVADFGLSRATTAHTSSGQALVGTVAYLSPELISGSPADARSDVYAVGILLYELLTGRQPFTAASPVQVAYKHVNERVPSPRALTPTVPEAIADLVLWCTEPTPDRRPDDASVLLAAAHELLVTEDPEQLDAVPPPRDAAAEQPADASPTAAVVYDPEGTHAPEPFVSPTPTDGDEQTVVLDADRVPQEQATTALPPHDAHTVPPGARDDVDPDETSVLPRTDVPTAQTRATPEPDTDAGDPGRVGDGPHEPADDEAADRGVAAVPPGPLTADASPAERGTHAEDPVPGSRAARRAARRPSVDIGAGTLRTLLIGVAVTLLLTGMALMLGWTLGAGNVPFSSAQGTVPPLVGAPREAAMAELAATGVQVDVSAEHDETMSAGSVIATVPAAGAAVERGDRVQLTVSSGPAPVLTPDLTGEQAESARLSARDAGLLAHVRERRHDRDVPEGEVISQDPEPGAESTRNSVVELVISSGPASHTVPDVTGRSSEQARERLEELGFDVRDDSLPGSSLLRLGGREGAVLRQEPAAGTRLEEGETVTLRSL